MTLDEFLASGEGCLAMFSRGECRLSRAYSLVVAVGYGPTAIEALADALATYGKRERAESMSLALAEAKL